MKGLVKKSEKMRFECAITNCQKDATRKVKSGKHRFVRACEEHAEWLEECERSFASLRREALRLFYGFGNNHSLKKKDERRWLPDGWKVPRVPTY